MNTFSGEEGPCLPLKGSLPLSRLAYRMHKMRENERGIKSSPVAKEHMKVNPDTQYRAQLKGGPKVA